MDDYLGHAFTKPVPNLQTLDSFRKSSGKFFINTCTMEAQSIPPRKEFTFERKIKKPEM